MRLAAFALLLPTATTLALAAEPSDESKRSPRVVNSVGMALVAIKPGEFQQGSAENEPGRDDDEHRHRVRITQPFHLGACEVTQAQYEAVMGANPSLFSAKGAWSERVEGEDTRHHPVDSVDWSDAMEFCRKLSELPAEKGAGRSYRLPTEAEWEYACRAGESWLWHHGNDVKHLPRVAWHGRDAVGHRTYPVASKPANAWGLHDMHGNVWEWCSDWHDREYYAKSPVENPVGPESGTMRVIRGGSWFSPAANCRCAERRGDPPSVGDPDTGFRVVMIQGEPAPPPK